MVTLPTPDAVRQGVELLSLGIDADRGFGPLLVVDVGGATTDVYSVVRSTSIGSQRKELVPSATTSDCVGAQRESSMPPAGWASSTRIESRV